MRRIYAGSLTLLCALGMVGSASAQRWVDNMSWRVESMGGATLAIEDETTALTTFNHQNDAGIALDKKVNRFDLGLDATDETSKLSTPYYDRKDENMTFEVVRPGAEYRGLTYWLNDSLVLRAGVEGMMNTSSIEVAQTGLATQTYKTNFAGIGGGLGLAFKTDFGLALGAGLTTIGSGGKPDRLDGQFNMIRIISHDPTAQTSKIEMTATNLNWSAGAAYELNKLGGDNMLTLGASVSSGDDRPNVKNMSLTSTPPLDLGDYSAVFTVEGTAANGAANITSKSTYTVAPLTVLGEAIFKMGSLLEAGLLIDSKTRDLNYKNEFTQKTALGSTTTNTDYKLSSETTMGITPIVQAIIPVGGISILPGVSYSSLGTGTRDGFALNGNTSYKSSSTKISRNGFSVGCGIQALEKKLQAAVQYNSGMEKDETTPYAVNGTAGTVSSSESSMNEVRLGGEYWVIPMLALRAGYAMTTAIQKDGAVTSTGQLTDLKNTRNRITLGAGVKPVEALTLDAMLKLDTYTVDPQPTYSPTHTGVGGYLGASVKF